MIQDAEIKSYCLTGILDNRLLSQTLDYLRISSNIDYRIEDMKTDDSKVLTVLGLYFGKENKEKCIIIK